MRTGRPIQNRVGEVWGEWTVIGPYKTKRCINRNTIWWFCRCSCGHEQWVTKQLLYEKGKCQKCVLRERTDRHNLIGRIFYNWTVIGDPKDFPVGSQGRNRKLWPCRCTCGEERYVGYFDLRTGKSTECGRCARKCPYGIASRNEVLASMKLSAKKRGYEWRLSESEFDALVQLNCYYCGTIPSNVCKGKGNNGDFVYSGLDRKDNEPYYDKNSVVPCCWNCNCAKQQMTAMGFISWVNRVFQYQNVNARIEGQESNRNSQRDSVHAPGVIWLRRSYLDGDGFDSSWSSLSRVG